MTEKEAFLFDLWGYVVLEGAPDGGQLGFANVEVDRHVRLSEPGLQGQ